MLCGTAIEPARQDMTEINLDRLAALLIQKVSKKRIIVALAGPPGVGKTTAMHRLVDTINDRRADLAAGLPLDGFHYDDLYLNQMGWRARKGAPHTFDVGGFAHMLERLKDNTEEQIAVPVFDRSLEIARAGAAVIPRSAKIIIAEGNYLLLDEQPWASLAAWFDVSVMIRADDAVIRQRLHDRWIKHEYSEDQINEKMQDNDLPNVATVVGNSREADYFVVTG